MGRRSCLAGALAVLVLAGAGCSRGSGTASPGSTAAPSGTSLGRLGVGSASEPRRGCSATRANGRVPPGEQSSSGAHYHGNGKLWTELLPGGVIRARPEDVRADGSIEIKFPWWRAVRGRLTISGQRLDGQAEPLRAWIPDYGPTGFQSTAITFPTQGCWEVTGRAGDGRLTFVVRVVAPA
jgi:hypothetical protein